MFVRFLERDEINPGKEAPEKWSPGKKSPEK